MRTGILKPFIWLYKQYPERYSSVKKEYGPGTATKQIIKETKQTRTSVKKSIEETKENLNKIPTSLIDARRKYLRKMREYRMTEEKRRHQFRVGKVLQIFAIIYYIAMMWHGTNVMGAVGSTVIQLFDGFLVFTILQMFTLLVTICYLIFTYKSFSAKNKMQLNPLYFPLILLKHPLELFPVNKFDEILEKEYEGYEELDNVRAYS